MARENRLVAVERLAPPSHAGRLHLTESVSRGANTRRRRDRNQEERRRHDDRPARNVQVRRQQQNERPATDVGEGDRGPGSPATAVETITLRATRGRRSHSARDSSPPTSMMREPGRVRQGRSHTA